MVQTFQRHEIWHMWGEVWMRNVWFSRCRYSFNKWLRSYYIPQGASEIQWLYRTLKDDMRHVKVCLDFVSAIAVTRKDQVDEQVEK